MYFKIEEIETPTEAQKLENPRPQKSRLHQGYKMIKSVFAAFWQMLRKRSIYYYNHFSLMIRRLSIRGEIIIVFASVFFISGVIITFDLYFANVQAKSLERSAQTVQAVILAQKQLEKEMLPVISVLEKGYLHQIGSNTLALDTVLTGITEKFKGKLYFTEIEKSAHSPLFQLKGVAVSLDALLALEQHLFAQCLYTSHHVNIQSDQSHYFDLTLHPISRCLI